MRHQKELFLEELDVADITKLNQIQLGTIKQILTLRYSTNLQTISQKLKPENFNLKQISNPDFIIEQSIRKSISNNITPNSKKLVYL